MNQKNTHLENVLEYCSTTTKSELKTDSNSKISLRSLNLAKLDEVKCNTLGEFPLLIRRFPSISCVQQLKLTIFKLESTS